MPKVKSFDDTSAVSVAYALSDRSRPEDFVTPTSFKLVPFTTENFGMSKESKTSTAIRGDRRTSGSKNTKGSAAGGLTIEFGANQISRDFLQWALQSTWQNATATPADGTYITDSDVKTYMAIEKTIKKGSLATDRLDHKRFYGTAANEATMAFGDGELVTLAISTMSAYADYRSEVAGANGLGGSIASVKTVPAPYEIADSSNNLKTIEVYDEDDELLELVWSDASLQIQNNVREQSALSHEFAAGIGFGKVAVTFSGEVYYGDQTFIEAHMRNKKVRVVLTISTEEGTYKITMPRMLVGAPTDNAEGENADYKESLTMTAEAGTVDIGTHPGLVCMIAIEFVPTP